MSATAAAASCCYVCVCSGLSTPAGVSIAAAESKRLRDALSRVGVMGSEVAKASFATKHLEQDLGRLLQVCVCMGGGAGGGVYVCVWGGCGREARTVLCAALYRETGCVFTRAKADVGTPGMQAPALHLPPC